MKSSRFSELTEETAKLRTSIGNTPLHIAAKSGRINEIPNNLLKLEFFLVKNDRGETPLHLAAQYGHLNQVSKEFLTGESLTVFDFDGNTPLHKAAGYEHIDQIPEKFLTSELLNLRARNHSAWTVFHHVACINAVEQIPRASITPEMWKARDGSGATPADYLSIARSSSYNRMRKIPLLKSRCYCCLGGIEFSENGIGHTVNCSHCGQKTKLGANPFAAPLKTKVEIRFSKCEPAPTAIPMSPPKQKRVPITPLAKLTKETIRSLTKSGNTPLHRAAQSGKIYEIPIHLLQTELFVARNSAGQTPIHVAAKYGHLDQVPLAFLSKETLTLKIGGGAYSTGSGYLAQTETALHIAVRCGYVKQIPKEFLTPEYLSIEATGYRLTLLHDLAYANRLDLVPEIYADHEMWNLKDYMGRTPRDLIEEKAQHAAYVEIVRSEPATEKQKEKLRWFGCTWDEGITKGKASDALDVCANQFPGRNAEYYSRPATEDQKAKLRSFSKNPENNRRDGPLTYGEAKDLIKYCERDVQRKLFDLPYEGFQPSPLTKR